MGKEAILRIERLAFGGEGVARSDGKVVFVPLTAPGDRVRVRMVTESERYDRGELVEVLESSPQRIEPRCAVFGRCGGCHWQHLDYSSQLRAKEEILRDTLERIGKIGDPKVLPMIGATEAWNYRNRIQLQVNQNGAVGFHARGSHEVVPFERCEIADDRLNVRIREIRSNEKIPAERFELAVGAEGRVSRVKESGFFSQVNAAQGELLQKTVIDGTLGRADAAFIQKWTVVDLYCGAGNFTLPLAGRVGKVFAVDESRPAVQAAEDEAIRKGLKNIEFIVGDVEWGLKKIFRRNGLIDVLLLDPPRAGAKEVLDLIGLASPRRIVYVSCDPATLARDLRILTHRQYRLDDIQPIDMFPQTYHIESVARLSRL